MLKVHPNILVRSVAYEFYKVNTGFFLTLFAVAFGFMKGAEHIALAAAFVSSWWLWCIPAIVSLIYAASTLYFNRNLLTSLPYTFTYNAGALSPTQLVAATLPVLMIQLLPVTMYFGFLSLVAFGLHAPLISIVNCIYVALLHGSCVVAFNSWIRWPYKLQEHRISPIIQQLSMRIPFVFTFPIWITKTQPLLIVGVKVASVALWSAVSLIYEEDYDLRFLAMGATVCLAFHATLVYYYHQFENHDFAWLRALPWSILYRTTFFLSILFILHLPEIGVVMRYFPPSLHWTGAVTLFIFCCGCYLLIYAYLFARLLPLEVFVKQVALLSLVLIVIILFGVPLLAFGMLSLVGAWLVLKQRFYSYDSSGDSHTAKNN